MIRRTVRLAADCALWCVCITAMGTVATLGACIGGVWTIATMRPHEPVEASGGD